MTGYSPHDKARVLMETIDAEVLERLGVMLAEKRTKDAMARHTAALEATAPASVHPSLSHPVDPAAIRKAVEATEPAPLDPQQEDSA